MLCFLSTAIAPHKKWNYIEPSTGYPFRDGDFQFVLNQVKAHRRIFNLDLLPGWQKRVEEEMCLYNESPCHDPEHPDQFKQLSVLERHGRKMWRELHEHADTRPTEFTSHDVKYSQDWFKSWESRVPSYNGCPCKQNWEDVRRTWSPNYESKKDLIKSFQVAHNLVNAKLGKPILEIN